MSEFVNDQFEQACRQAYGSGRGDLSGKDSCITCRRLDTSEVYEGYNDLLPYVDGLDYIHLLRRRAALKREQTVCDVGPGKGLALLDISHKFPRRFSLLAFGSPAASQNDRILRNGKVFGPTYNLLQKAGINFQEGNLIDIDNLLKPHSVDILTMVFVLEHTLLPPELAFSKINRVLAPGGVAMVAGSHQIFKNDSDRLAAVQNLEGSSLTVDTISFYRPCDDSYFPASTALLRKTAN